VVASQYYLSMLFLKYAPKPPLSEFVELFWYYEGYTQPHAKERIMPDGSMQVVINLREDELRIYDTDRPELFEKLSGSIFAGPRSRYEVIDTASQASLIGIHFRPGGVSRFFKPPTSELLDQNLSLECLWGSSGADIRGRILEGATPRERFLTFERCLLEQARKPFVRHPAVHAALAFITGEFSGTVAELTDRIGISRRRFVQVFSDEIGLAPKLFCRIQRFQSVLRAVHGKDGNEIDWADVALDAGYFDQAHFNHDFREFSGISPGTYLKHRTAHLNHVPLIE